MRTLAAYPGEEDAEKEVEKEVGEMGFGARSQWLWLKKHGV